MKIECDKCGAKYSIADDKVRGKTFKIRCKKCSNVIIVRDKAGGAESEGDQPSDEPGWHLAIGGETVGPLTEQEVRDRFAAGEIDGETSVWQEGFEDWLPLSQVSVFSDLADKSGGGASEPAADPFSAGADEDPYSAPAGGDYGRSPEPARAAEPARVASPAAASSPAASSSPAGGNGKADPRVKDLTGARNENSVLFSLDSLSSIAMGSKPGGGAAASPTPSFSAPSGGGGGGGGGGGPSATGTSEGSGLIDIRSMSGMLGGGGGGGASGGPESDRDDSMLPSFGGTGFGGLSAAPLLVASQAPAAEHATPAEPPPRASQAPIYIMMVLILLGMGGLAFYILTRPPPEPTEKVVERIITVPGESKEKDDKEDKEKDDKEDKADKEPEGEAEGDAAGDDKKGTTPKKTGDKKTAVKTGDKKTDDKKDSPAGGDAGKTEKKTEEKKEDDYSVDCILDPSKCKKKGAGGDSGGGGGSKPPPDSSMPEKLSASDVTSGISPAKAAAKSNCAKLAKGGEKVVIKLSIAGPSGTVASSSVMDAAGNDQLANCVAQELKKATFPKTQKEAQGSQVSVGF